MPFDITETGPKVSNRPPPTKTCYICGREFGSKSITIHEPKCLEKWKFENDKKPKKERLALPKKPEIITNAEGKIDVEATNQAAWEQAQANLTPCQYCGRKFKYDRLEVHNKSCTKERPCKKVNK
ncbi:Zinc finger protein 474 [Strongyloides ratti]|uniref:Zinc finger protein 474 n=1 Tax=Strongyloides ratti TaxID=34506 RepID=A0A090LHZ1_STRRB|nr:Zinc finger protein 474 [Strongyloides ratti]CEF67743.1 Zinc finger protein 474 [Strongyloides ratti]